jgi:hypothetical protein
LIPIPGPLLSLLDIGILTFKWNDLSLSLNADMRLAIRSNETTVSIPLSSRIKIFSVVGREVLQCLIFGYKSYD